MKYRAQLALLVDHPPDGAQWIHELKLDGYRIGILIDSGRVDLISRRNTKWTAEFPELVASAKKIRVKRAMIDGEVVMLSESGISSFEALQNRGNARGTLAFFAFDLLSLDGADVSREPLVERKQRLRELIGSGVGIIRYTEHFDDPGTQVLRQACQLGAEGIVSKRRDAPYRWGARHADWQKSKCSKRQEFVVGGFTDPSGSRVGVGSILVGYYEGEALRFAGKVGTGRGWSATFGRELRRKLERIEQASSPFTPRPPGWLGRNAHWVKPVHVVEVEFTEWTTGGHIRHPSLQGFRSDKSPADVVKEVPVVAAPPPRAKTPAPPRLRSRREDSTRLMYAKPRLTRGDLAAVYERIAGWVMPHVQGRPLTVVRCKMPVSRADALRSQCAFVRHTARENAWASAGTPRIRIPEQKKIGEYLYVDSLPALRALIERGAVEWHAWNARVDDVEHPDRIVFDLDPGDAATWQQVIAAARRVRDALTSLHLECWPKTTGGRGLHVVVPFARGPSWDSVFEFSRAVALAIEETDRTTFTTSFSRTARSQKVLIDYKRNYRTSIAVAAFSTRARPGAPMSVPVSWREVTARLRPDQFTVANILARIARVAKRGDPWIDYWSCDQRLPV